MISNVIREITPLRAGDCFTIFSSVKEKFEIPLHHHDEYELILIINGKGAKRIVGTHIEAIEDLELMLIGPNVSHGWMTHECQSKETKEITIQFPKDLFDDKLLRRNQLSFFKNMLEHSQRGILFSEETVFMLKERIISLNNKIGLDSVLELFSILHELSVSKNMKTLSNFSFSNYQTNFNSRRIEKVFEHINTHYDKAITLEDTAKIANMSAASFSRFIKRRTGRTFIDSLNEIRLGYASRMLIDTTNTVSEIAFKCGFNNISHFNRIFKRQKLCIPKDFRKTYTGNRLFI